MSLSIVSNCIGCWACDTVCPSAAIRLGATHHEIDPQRCDECAGAYAEPQCASICPVEGAIIDASGEPLNPPGSLGGWLPRVMEASSIDVLSEEHRV